LDAGDFGGAGLSNFRGTTGALTFLVGLVQVKTELVLRALRPEYTEEAAAQALLDLYFQASEDMDEADRGRYAFVTLNRFEYFGWVGVVAWSGYQRNWGCGRYTLPMCSYCVVFGRRAELQEAIDNPEKIAVVQEQYPTATVQTALAEYVTKARHELGPPVVKVSRKLKLSKPTHAGVSTLLQICVSSFGVAS
jgi:hypothetical protein